MAASSSNHSQKRHGGTKPVEMEEIVRYMSNLPSYLERGKPMQDRALNFGVMDWGRLEKWQYHHRKQGVAGNNKYSSSSSNSSLLSSNDGSSPHSSKGQSSSPALLKPDHVTLRSHLNISPDEISSRLEKSCSGNLEKSQDVKDALVNHSSKKKTTIRSHTKPRNFKMNDFYPQNLPESKSSDDLESFHTASSSSSSKGKMKIQDELDYPVNTQTNDDIPISFSLETKVGNRRNSWNIEADSERNPSRPFKSKFSEEKESSVSSKNPNFETVTLAGNKPRNVSPRSRFRVSMSSNVLKTAEPPPVSHQTHPSPLKRLLDPLFPSKATYAETSSEDLKIKPKVKLDFGSCKEVKVDYSCRNNKTAESSSTNQALFQMAIKNGRPLFTFSVDNNIEILAATVRSLNGKDSSNSWIYTFFAIHEVKKKKSGWLSHSTKGIGQGYLPNVTAQMKVSNPSVYNGTTREFVLASVEPHRLDHEMLDALPQDELAAIVVRFIRKTDVEGDQDRFSMTVILPGGHHSVPSKGEPSSLIERWQSGGVCDCGGWDIGCRLRTLTNKVQSDRISTSPEARMPSGNFELFFQGEVTNDRPFFNLCPLKEGIFSVEYNSSLSLLHAFSICISVIECRKSSKHTEFGTYVAKQVDDDDEAPVTYTSLPPLSPVGRV